MSNISILELCPKDNWYGSGLLQDDCLLRGSAASMSLAFVTQSNVPPPLTITGSNLKVVGNLDIANGALTSNGSPYFAATATAPATPSNFSVIFRTSNIGTFSGILTKARNQWYVFNKRSNCGYELSNVLDANGRIAFPVNGHYTIGWSVVTNQSTGGAGIFLDAYNGFGSVNNASPAWRMASIDSRQFGATVFFSHNFLTTDVISPKAYSPSPQTPNSNNGGWYISVTLHNPV